MNRATRSIALALCLMLPAAALAEEPAPPPAADQPTPAALTPQDAPADAPQPAVENARWCGAHGGCNGARKGGGWILIGGVAGTVLTAVAVGVAVSVATHKNGPPVTP